MDLNYTNVLIFILVSAILLYLFLNNNNNTNLSVPIKKHIKPKTKHSINKSNKAAQLFILTDINDLTSELTDITFDSTDDLDDIINALDSTKIKGGESNDSSSNQDSQKQIVADKISSIEKTYFEEQESRNQELIKIEDVLKDFNNKISDSQNLKNLTSGDLEKINSIKAKKAALDKLTNDLQYNYSSIISKAVARKDLEDIKKEAVRNMRLLQQKKQELINKNDNKNQTLIDEYVNLEKELQLEQINLDNLIKDKEINIKDMENKILEVKKLQNNIKTESDNIKLLLQNREQLAKDLQIVTMKTALAKNNSLNIAPIQQSTQTQASAPITPSTDALSDAVKKGISDAKKNTLDALKYLE
tara:strand:+ start:66 stop:1145 length:1080 start_codon:yes stop_codon:yes gene_type:complete